MWCCQKYTKCCTQKNVQTLTAVSYHKKSRSSGKHMMKEVADSLMFNTLERSYSIYIWAMSLQRILFIYLFLLNSLLQQKTGYCDPQKVQKKLCSQGWLWLFIWTLFFLRAELFHLTNSFAWHLGARYETKSERPSHATPSASHCSHRFSGHILWSVSVRAAEH